MRRSRHPRPKERKTGNHQYPCGNPPPHGRPPNASPGASETAVNLAAGTTLRRPNKGAPGSGWKNPDQNLDEEDRRTSRPTRRGYRRLKSRPSPLTPGETPRRQRSRQHPPHPKVEADEDALQTGISSTLAEDRDAPERGERTKSQEELPVCAPQAHAWNGKEKRQISHPQTNLWKSDSASPR